MLHRRLTLAKAAAAAATVAFIFSLATPTSAHAQGCALCRDNAASTPPRTQAAYRHAIVLLGTTGCVIFASTMLLFKRQR
jgi:hypothetical protein